MSDSLTPPISEAQVETFERDGAVCLRGALAPEWVALVAQGIEKALGDPGPYARVQSAADDPGLFHTDYFMWRRIPELERFARQGPGGAIAARLLRSGGINYFFDGLFVKEPGTVKPSLWHQDQVYYNVDGAQVMVMWIPVDPVARDCCLELVRGSHRWGRSFLPKMIRDERPLVGAEDGFEPMPDIDGHRGDYEILSWDMEPGDCIAFSAMVVHGSPGNRSSTRRRRAISTTWLGDDAVYGERPGEVEPRIEGRVFSPGERLDVPEIFPQVWPRP